MLKPQSREVLPKLALAYYGEGELETARSIYEDILRQNEKMPSAWNGIGLILVQEGKFREAYDYFGTALKHQSNFPPSLFNQGVIAYPSLKRPDLAVKKLREFTFQAPDSALTPRAKSMANSLEDRLLSKTPPEPANMEVAIQDKTTVNSNQINSQKPSLETLEPTNQAESTETTEPAVAVIQDEETSSPQTNLAELSESSAAEKKQSASNPQPETNLAGVQPDIPDQENEPAPPQVAPSNETKPAKPGEDQPIGMRTDKTELVTSPTEETFTITSDTDLKKASSNTPLVRSSQPGVTPLPEGLPFNPYKYLLPGAPLPGNRNKAASWFKKGNRAFQQNDYEEAVEAYEKAVVEDPAYFEAYFNLGLAALRGGNAVKALPACELALAIQPNHRDSRYNLSLALEKLNHFRDAARELETLLKENADDTQILMRLGNLYAGPLQRPVRTREVYSHLLKLSPGSPESRTAQRWLYENP
jgi:tetratricopeptide (TPR) repeat protein